MTDLSAVDLNLLVALDLLLDERSVRGAARRAHLTPSAMSHTLARLRDLLGDELLVRAGRAMVLTPRAEALGPPVKALLASARALLRPADSFDPALLRRRFHVVCTDHVAAVLLTPAEALLRDEAPGVDLLVAPLGPETMSELRNGSVDVAIGVFPDAPPELRARRLFVDHFVTVCRPGHPRVRQGALTMDAFLAERHTLVAPRGTPTGHVDAALARLGQQRRVARAFPTFWPALWHTAHSDDLLTVSARLVHAVRAAVPLQVHTPPLALDPYTLVLAWHPRTDRAPDDAWLRALLVRAAAGLDRHDPDPRPAGADDARR